MNLSQIISIIVSIIGAIVSVIGAIVSVMSSLNKYKIDCNLELIKEQNDSNPDVKLQLKNLNKETVMSVFDKKGTMYIKITSDKPDFSKYSDYVCRYLQVLDNKKLCEIIYQNRIKDIEKLLGSSNILDIKEIDYGKIVSTYDKTNIIVYRYPQFKEYDTFNINERIKTICTESVLVYKNILPELYKKLGFDLLIANSAYPLLDAFSYMINYLSAGKRFLENQLYEHNFANQLRTFLITLSKSELLQEEGVKLVNESLKKVNSLQELMEEYYDNFYNTEEIPINIIYSDYVKLLELGFNTIMPNKLFLELTCKNKKLFNRKETHKLYSYINID